ERFLRYAAAERRGVLWVLGDVARMPVAPGSVDRVLMSLLLHRVPDPAAVIAEAARILRPGGMILIKTVAPEDAAVAVPYRFFPAMVAAQRSRMPATDALAAWIEQAGLGEPQVHRIVRERRLRPDELEQEIRSAVPVRYPEMDPEQLEDGLARMHTELAAQPIEPRINTVLVAVKPDRAW
ncbi:MAG TPA: class I SAM-dependent methyltransferase, partial [Mycobacteriales bacterium]|nr:class I SAM-dependent methyltransferase [Mycobacteriales bacterium]